MEIKLSLLKEKYRKIPELCPLCSSELSGGDSVEQDCKKCKITFEFGYFARFFFGGYWYIKRLKRKEHKR